MTRFQKLIESEEGKSSPGAGAEDQARRTGMTQTQHTTHATGNYNKVAEMLESGRPSRKEVQAKDNHIRQERHGKKQSNRHSRQPDIVDPQAVTHRTTRLHVEHVNVPYASSASSRHHHHRSTSGWPEVQSGVWAGQEELGEHPPEGQDTREEDENSSVAGMSELSSIPPEASGRGNLTIDSEASSVVHPPADLSVPDQQTQPLVAQREGAGNGLGSSPQQHPLHIVHRMTPNHKKAEQGRAADGKQDQIQSQLQVLEQVSMYHDYVINSAHNV